MKFLLYSIITVAVVAFVLVFAVWDRLGEQINDLINPTQDAPTDVTTDQSLHTTADGFTWYRDRAGRVQLVIFDKPIELLFSSAEAQSLKEQSIQNQFNLAINGSFFRGSYVAAEHSGLLQIRGNILSEYIPNVQITHVVVYNHRTDAIQMVRASQLPSAFHNDLSYSLMQTGPLLLQNNTVQIEFINNSLNGDQEALRTVLGFTESGKKFVLITKVQTNLTDLANEILQLPPLQGELVTAINLDGGSSTAMYSKLTTSFNFREVIRLPLVIGVP